METRDKYVLENVFGFSMSLYPREWYILKGNSDVLKIKKFLLIDADIEDRNKLRIG